MTDHDSVVNAGDDEVSAMAAVCTDLIDETLNSTFLPNDTDQCTDLPSHSVKKG